MLEIPSRKVLRSLRLLILFHFGGLDDNETTTDKHSLPPPAHAGMRQPRRVLRVHTVSLTDQPTQGCRPDCSSGKLVQQRQLERQAGAAIILPSSGHRHSDSFCGR